MSQVADLSNYPNVIYKIYNTSEKIYPVHNTESMETNSDLQKIKIFPNPYTASSGQYLTFSKLPYNVSIKIYNISGELIWEKENTYNNVSVQWNVENKYGKKISSGIYIYVIIDKNGQSITGKIAVIQ